MTTILEAVTEYRYAHSSLSPHTRRNHKSRLSLFVAWCEKQKLTLETLKASHVRAFLDDVSQHTGMKTPLVRTSTVISYGKSIKAFLSWCAKEEDYNISTKLSTRIEVPKADETIIETFSPLQIEALFQAAEKQAFPVRDKAILCVLLDTGVRASELVGLTLDCVWLDADDSYIKVMGKGRKEREIPLGRIARLALRRYVSRYRKASTPKEQHVFLNHVGKPLTRNGLHQIIQPIGERAHIQGVRCSAHTFRHTMAELFLLNGGDIYKLSRLLGHSNVPMTEVYLRAIRAKQVRQGGESVLDRLKKDV